MNKPEAKRIARTIAGQAIRACSCVVDFCDDAADSKRIRDCFPDIAHALERTGTAVPANNNKIGNATGQDKVFRALIACQQIMRPLSGPQRQAVFRGLHAWFLSSEKAISFPEDD